ncbi:HAD family hydrolase [Bacteroides sp. 224]|uniref:HAD family hydrolase n=1 Tax=Bacteroides sp. 224 TaxID=2302936 RepID=UPI0013D263F4|nr:HAD family hydrolase [Bacteroides sp. 224]NDV67183.1 haloacid dehalogenase-like hydrolase [Bacteroides sp. 224]
MSKKPIVALIYDFDGTLSPGNMQEFGFIQAIGKDSKAFWGKNKKLSEDNDASGILCYMYLMLQAAQAESISLLRDSFRNFGKDVELFKGVKEWFTLINSYGKSVGVNIEHYINSSGLTEMIEGTPIFKEFKKIYACSYLYDVDGKAVWPAVAVDYTAKTQFLFKINKGIEKVSDNHKINQHIPEKDRRVPFSNMIYFGDGETDIPCMKLIKDQGGHSIAVYKPGSSKKKQTAENLIRENRVNFVCSADYSENKEMYKVVKTIIDKIKADIDFNTLQENHKSKCSTDKE